jgi:hypothetical protein
MKVDRIFTIAACGVALAGVVLAFVVIGSPSHARLVALDTQRVDDLRSMATKMHERYATTSLPPRLPNDLGMRDPATNRPYVFRRVDRSNYELCATFSVASEQSETHGSSR